MRIQNTLFVALITLMVSSQASATLILEEYGTGVATPDTIGGYAMTDFANTGADGSTTVTSIDSPISGNITFLNKYGVETPMVHTSVDNLNWWNTGEGNYDVYGTDLNYIELIMPENTRAFSFNVGANLSDTTRDNAWLLASETDGSGISKTYFNVDNASTPGFAIYADNSQGSCSAITSVVIDPYLLWGFGNFSINQGECASVPAPSALVLLGAGLLGLGAIRRRKTA